MSAGWLGRSWDRFGYLGPLTFDPGILQEQALFVCLVSTSILIVLIRLFCSGWLIVYYFVVMSFLFFLFSPLYFVFIFRPLV